MSAQWKGADTGSGRTRFAPASLSLTPAFSTAPAGAGDHGLGGLVVVRGGDHLARLGRDRGADLPHLLRGRGPRTALIAPFPCGTASCMKVPRARTAFAASAAPQRARRDERGVLAERVAGDEVGDDAAAARAPPPPPPRRSGSRAGCWR